MLSFFEVESIHGQMRQAQGGTRCPLVVVALAKAAQRVGIVPALSPDIRAFSY